VLVVEDNPVGQMVMRKQLEKFRVSFSITGSAEEAVEIWTKASNRIPLILMDVEVDGPINGLEATKRIRELEEGLAEEAGDNAERGNRRSFIAIMTGRALESDRQEALSCGCDAFLAKPVRMETVKDLIQTKVRGQ
jgi:CheY-like chemotaxis protein